MFGWFQAVVEDAVDHVVIVFHEHLCVAQRILRREERRQLDKANAVRIVTAGLSIDCQSYHVTHTHAAPMKVFGMTAIEAKKQFFKERIRFFK